MKNIWYLLQMVREYRSRIIKVTIANTILGLVFVAIPYLFKLIVDDIALVAAGGKASQEAVGQIWFLFIVLIGIRCVQIIAGYFQERQADILWSDMMTGLRSQAYARLSELSIDFFEQRRSGDIISLVNRGVMDVNRWLHTISQGALVTLFQTIFAIILLATQYGWIGLVATTVVLLNIYNAWVKLRQTKPLRLERDRLADKGYGKMNEMIGLIATVRSFAAEAAMLVNFETIQQQFKQTQLGFFRAQWRANNYRNVINGLGTFGAVAIVIHGALRGQYTPGDIFLVLSLTQSLVGNLQPLTRSINDTGEAETTAQQLVALLETKPTVADRPNARELDQIKTVAFHHVSFRYPGKRRKVIEDISFTIEPGATVALVGPSGVGKSTIIKLLLRFYDPSAGKILINGRDAREYTQASIRRRMAVVMQDVALFNDTAEANLAFANPQADRSQLIAAATQAHADVFINKLPQKYQTIVGERGIRLSGGERQRMAIARAILKDPDLLILDEATSALDSESERYVQDGLRQLMNDKAALVIAHRLSTIMHANQILVFKEGQIVERGTHDELLAQEGAYAKLIRLQSGALRQIV